MAMKKILKCLGVIILLLVSAFFSLGIFIPSLNYDNKILVNKPVEQSFRVFTNVFSFSEWIPGFKNIKWLSGKQNEIGSKWEMTVVQEGEKYTMTETLTYFKENELFAFKLENDKIFDVMINSYAHHFGKPLKFGEQIRNNMLEVARKYNINITPELEKKLNILYPQVKIAA